MPLTTKPPFRFFFWLSVSFLFTAYLAIEGMVLWGALFYGIGGIVLLYWVASNKDCRITLTDEVIEITFHRTFWKKKTFPLKGIDQMELIKADPFWKLFFINNSVERYYRSQDKLILVSGEMSHEIMINTNQADLNVLLNHFIKTRMASNFNG